MADKLSPSAELTRIAADDLYCPKNCTDAGVAYRSSFRSLNAADRVSGVGVCLNGTVAALPVASPGGFADSVGVELSLVLADLGPATTPAAEKSLARIRAMCEEFDAKVWKEIAVLMAARNRR